MVGAADVRPLFGETTMKFHSKAIEEHDEVPLADAGRWNALVEHWRRREADLDDHRADARRSGVAQGIGCYVLSVHRREAHAAITSAEAQLAEITQLVLAQGDRVLGSECYRLDRPDPRTLIRRGVADRIGDNARACGATMLVIDAELTPSQARNLEDASGLPVCDREAVILNVFERNATTRRARLQVEVAHLEYLRPRIRGIGLNMDQQGGGTVLSRGAGETASELLARRIDDRIADLRRRLDALKQADRAQRKHRASCQRVVLVGYTNAGKTSLMNALSDASLSARDRPFETLDATSRCLTRHGGDVLLSDTVGFIRNLPERLFSSFESTLAEVSEATLLLVVVDASDPEREKHLSTTDDVLSKLGASALRRLIVFNKIDRVAGGVDRATLEALSVSHPFVALSSHDTEAVAALRETLLEMVRVDQRMREVFVPYDRVDLSDAIYRACRVRTAVASARGTQLVIEGERHVVDSIARAAGKVRQQ